MFLDKYGNPLYIGRATSLRRRVLSYFQGLRDSRLEEMLSLAAKIKHYKTDNLLEAVILEANLIKKNWPKYNVREKDNRSFIYIVIPKIDFPRPLIVRQREFQKFSPRAKIFGPYQSLSLIKNALRIIRRIFPYSVCKVGSGKPCFDRQIGLCPGACVNKISKKDYQKNIDNIILLLNGEKKKLLKKLQRENPIARQGLKHLQDVSLIAKSEFENFKSNFGGFQMHLTIDWQVVFQVIGSIAALTISIVGFFSARTLNKIDANQTELFNRVHSLEVDFFTLKGEHLQHIKK